jgi:hypothetical protein
MIFKQSDAGRFQDGFNTEKNDCTVRAAAVRFCTSYRRAHEICEEIGRRDGHGLKLIHIKNLFEKMGLEYQKPIFRPTLKQFIEQHPAGRWFVVVRGHAIGISNGVIIDTVTPRPRARVLIYA